MGIKEDIKNEYENKNQQTGHLHKKQDYCNFV